MKVSIEKIHKNKESVLKANLGDSHNNTWNRFDILYKGHFELYLVSDNQNQFYIPYHKDDQKTGHLGLFLREIPDNFIKELIKFLFVSDKKLMRIFCRHLLHKIYNLKPTWHYHIDLPKDLQTFDANLSKNSKFKIRYYSNKLAKEVGPYEITHLTGDGITPSIVQSYLHLKSKTHDANYGIDHSKFIYIYKEKFAITDAFLLSIQDKIVGIIFLSCVDSSVLIDNLTYDTELKQYSIGTILYSHVLKYLIEKRYKIFLIGGGTLLYKTRFNSVQKQTYSGFILRPWYYPIRIGEKVSDKVKKIYKKLF